MHASRIRQLSQRDTESVDRSQAATDRDERVLSCPQVGGCCVPNAASAREFNFSTRRRSVYANWFGSEHDGLQASPLGVGVGEPYLITRHHRAAGCFVAS